MSENKFKMRLIPVKELTAILSNPELLDYN